MTYNNKSIAKGLVFSLVLILVSTISSYGQSDNVLWASVQLRKKFSPDWSLQVQPIIRYDQDISSYQNASLDVSLRRNLGAGWHVQLLGRTWAMPNRSDRQFLWLDVGHSAVIPSLKLAINNRVRFHQAFDIGGFTDLDYIRYIIQLVPTNSWKLKPTLAFEPWFILNDVDIYRVARIEPGLRYKFNDTFGLTTIWRREIDTNSETDVKITRNLWVVALVYNL